MSISKERVERATRLYCCGERGCERENRTRFPDGCMAHKYADDAKAFLTADAPALLAARIEGLREGGEIALGMICNGRTLSSEIAAAIDRRIAELSSQEAEDVS